jgi:hypothetical protein
MTTIADTKRLTFLLAFLSLCGCAPQFEATKPNDSKSLIKYHRTVICLEPGEPTQITFPDKVKGGFKDGPCPNLSLDRVEQHVVIFARHEHRRCDYPVWLDDGSLYVLRLERASETCARVQFGEIVED